MQWCKVDLMEVHYFAEQWVTLQNSYLEIAKIPRLL